MRIFSVILPIFFIAPQSCRAGEGPEYERDIKPIFKERCFACHGALKQKAKLRLDSGELIRRGGRNGAVVNSGDPAKSLLLERVTAKEERERMPPEGKPLTGEQIKLLKAWIAQGAKSPPGEKPEEDPNKHWAFQRPVKSSVPKVGRVGWDHNPIDAFVALEHERHGLIPAPPAEKAVLLRRVYLDLIGLPPSREELHKFLADGSTDAYEKVVEQLLQSPEYGERWARHWMDVWRYSDWYGARSNNDNRNSYGQMWRWRDWIVRSLNDDKGYDRMVMEMLAADEIVPEDDANLVATGFVVRNWFKWNYDVWKKDLVEHTAKAFLGLTMNCCFCHDHKYDPISQEEYFRFRAFFEPLEIRQDRLPGEPDPGPYKKYIYGSTSPPMTSGMVRACDEFLEMPTFMFKLGDARNRFEGKPAVMPAAPTCLGGERVKIEPVSLSPAAHYPGLKPFVQQEELSRATKALRFAHSAVATSLEKLAAVHKRLASSTLAPSTELQSAENEVQKTQAHLATATAALRSLKTRIQADKIRYKLAAGNADEAARAASRSEGEEASCVTKEKLIAAEQAVTAARSKQASDPKSNAELAKLEAQFAAATAEVNAAKKALDSVGTKYTPLGPVYAAKSSGRRAALSRWLASKDNPLTARVAVNHMWNWHFGRPLVETTFNFGRSGKPSSHPELLDWLAVELMDKGWSQKHLHRLMVKSNAYRMRSQLGGKDDSNLARDRDNRYLWRFQSSRVDAEVVRDSVLCVAGALDRAQGGPDIDFAKGQTTRRRSIYLTHHAEAKMEFLDLFDAANACDCYKRSVSVLPQQALAMTNSPMTREHAVVLAKRLWEQTVAGKGGDGHFIQSAFEEVLSRLPSPQETEASMAFLADQRGLLMNVSPKVIDPAARARGDLVHALFSHGDFVTIR